MDGGRETVLPVRKPDGCERAAVAFSLPVRGNSQRLPLIAPARRLGRTNRRGARLPEWGRGFVERVRFDPPELSAGSGGKIADVHPD
jgi:hypothetical protein